MNLLIIEILGSLKKLTRPQKIIFSFLVDTTLFFFAVYISFLITSYTLSDEKVSGFFSIWFFFSILLTTSLCSYFSNINQIVLHTIDIKSL